jgi:hypothetical protein
MPDFASGLRYARRQLRRGSKWAGQRLRPAEGPARALFVVGCQRSGTTMLMDVLDRSPSTWVYQEFDRAAFRHWKLRPREVRESLLARSRAAWLVFKPLYDAQRLDELLADHPEARAVWVSRDWRDVAASSARKWGERLPRVVQRLVEEHPCDHWMADRLPVQRRARLAELFHPDLSIDTAAALRWWLRNEVYFDQALHERGDRILSVRYEELVSRPQQAFGVLFGFLGLSPDPLWLEDVSAASVGRAPALDVDAPVAALCDALMARLDAAAAESGR